MRILIIEDEIKTAHYLAKGLQADGYLVDTAQDGETGLFLAHEYTYDLVILDVMLPKIDGWSVITQLRNLKSDIRILFLTARDAVKDKVKAFDLGADDYLIKPFAFSELLGRVRALLRRQVIPRLGQIRVDDLEIDVIKHEVVRNNKKIHLTTQEFKLLIFLAEHEAEVLSRTLIAESVWDIHFNTETNVVDVAIKRLREKIDADFDNKLIHTVRGRGYVLKES